MPPYNVQVISNTGVPKGLIRENLFPKLRRVIGRHFEWASVFHGWSADSICIGRSAPPTKLGTCCSAFGTAAGETPILH